ncbi:PAX3- and PAX7-binding protein [Spatholobus suberectus]|nr:PAX3- and PAX7-binding protein [Spatholobus suberectus]
MFVEKVEGGKNGVLEEVEERRMDHVRLRGEEDEEKMWEEERFRKGLGKRMDEGFGRVDVPVMQGAQQHMLVIPSTTTVYSGVPSAIARMVLVSPSIGGAIE